MKTDVIVGALYGDEGKGKYVGWVGRRYDAVLRVNASTNAGHCVSDGERAYVTRQLPSVFFPEDTLLVLAPGALLNLVALEAELRGRPDVEALADKLKIASSISLVIRPYVEKGQGGLSKLLGSTHQGTGPSAAARTARHSLRLYDIEHVANGGEQESQFVIEKIARSCRETSPLLFSSDFAEHEPYYREVLDELVTAFRSIRDMIGSSFYIDYTRLLVSELSVGSKRVLIEGCNGMLLDNLHGALPHVTSASTNLGAMLCGANLSPATAGDLIVVMAAYGTCLGKRPFPAEMTADEAKHFYANCNEVDVAQHETRRLGWLDLPALRKALAGSAGALLHMNKLDVLSGLRTINVCARYRIGDRELDLMPDDPCLLERAEAVYMTVEGWDESIAAARTFDELPRNARRYVQLITDELPNKIVSLGVGPANDDVIQL